MFRIRADAGVLRAGRVECKRQDTLLVNRGSAAHDVTRPDIEHDDLRLLTDAAHMQTKASSMVYAFIETVNVRLREAELQDEPCWRRLDLENIRVCVWGGGILIIGTYHG